MNIGTFEITVERDSVAAGDDVDAPHRVVVIVENNGGMIDFAAFFGRIATNYFPSVGGGSTWVAFSDDIPIAVIRFTDDKKATIWETDQAVCTPLPTKFSFRYYLANSPYRLLEEIKLGGIPERQFVERWPTVGQRR